MPYKIAEAYYEAITVIEARDRLVDLNIADYPRMKKEGRKKFHKALDKMAYPISNKKQLTAQDLKRKLNSGGFGN